MKKTEKKVKEGFFTRLLKKIEQSNNMSFGGKRIDCCNIQEKRGK